MSVLQIYLNWVNSIVSEVDGDASHSVSSIQEGRILCQLIDILCYDARLLQKVETSTDVNAQSYLRAALDHMRNHGIKFHFTPQDILDGDIKSILDVLWLLILNYCVHSIASSPYQRSVGIGKKVLLDWCQRELQIDFDAQDSLTYNLCSGDSFVKLLAKHSGLPITDSTEREETLKTLLLSIQDKCGVRQEIISSSDIIDGTVDEHTLMIYVSLLKLKVADNVEAPLTPHSDLSFQSTERPPLEDTAPREVTVVDDAGQPSSTEVAVVSESSRSGSPEPVPPHKDSDHDTSDWTSVSSESPVSVSPISSTNDKSMEPKVAAYANEDTLINDTTTKHIDEHIGPSDPTQKGPMSRIPVRVKSVDDSENTHEHVGDEHNKDIVRKISVKVQRPRSPQSIMAEQRLKQEAEKAKKRKEKEEMERKKKEREEVERKKSEPVKEGPVLTGSASEGGDGAVNRRFVKMPDLGSPDPVKSDDDDQEKAIAMKNLGPEFFTKFEQLSGGGGGMPVFVIPGQKHDMDLLLEALRHARTEANMQDQRIQGANDSTDLKKTVDKHIENLEEQLKAVKAQSMEMFAEAKADQDKTELKAPSRSRTPVHEPHSGGRGERHSPPRGIRDVMANHDIHPIEQATRDNLDILEFPRKEESSERNVPHGILRHHSPTAHLLRRRSPVDNAGEGGRDRSRSPSRYRPISPARLEGGTDEQDDDKRLIKFLSKEIENMKLKMAIMEKNQERSRSPYGHGPRVTSGLPQRDRSPSEISSRARARFTDIDSDASLSSCSPPPRRGRSMEMIDRTERSRSRSPRFHHTRSPTDSPTRLPVRSFTPDTFSRERIRPFSPSARVLSLQDLSTSVYDNPEGKVTFTPASGAKSVELGYSSPIHKVTQEIWGYDHTEDEYYQDVAKYEKWKRLISRDAVTDEDMLELKQALASALVELDILQAKLNNANADIKDKMGKTTDILNDCRAHLSKAQAENVELRGQIERERTRAIALEIRLKDLEESLHSSKANQNDATQELEQSVFTLKGIVGMDKTHMSALDEENNKLRQKLTEMQRENIKLKEDFGELKMYNDKAQTTVKDLKSCLEDARKERKLLSEEIKRIHEAGSKNTVSNIINHYLEKGLYEEPEKSADHQRSRSRNVSPSKSRPISLTRSRSTSPRRYRARSVSPVLAGTRTPVMTKALDENKTSTYSTLGYTERSQTPVDQSYNYEDISPTASDGHEIYPHRRTRSYVQKFGSQNDGIDSPVDLSDPELEDLMKPKSKLNYDVDLTDNSTQYVAEPDRREHFKIEENSARISSKRRLMYSPYRDNAVKSQSTQMYDKDKTYIENETQPYIKPASKQNPITNEELANRKFIRALDTAVKETPSQLAQKRLLNELDNADQWTHPSSRSILKTKKSAQNTSIQENIRLRRSYESRSYSPSVREPMTRSFSPTAIPFISSAPSRPYIANRPYKPNEARTTHVPLQAKPRSHSPGNAGAMSYFPKRQMSPERSVGRCYSPEQRYRAGNTGNSARRDSGYSTPTKPIQRSADHSHTATSQSSMPRIAHRLTKLDPKTPMSTPLTDEERHYADLLIQKYTRENFSCISVPSS